DFRPASRAGAKVKKEQAPLTLSLERTPDILALLGSGRGGRSDKRSKRRLLVGFAAETDDLVGNARAKLKSKNLDLIVANNVGPAAGNGGFAADANEVVVIDRKGGELRWPLMSKTEVAARLMALVAEMLS